MEWLLVVLVILNFLHNVLTVSAIAIPKDIPESTSVTPTCRNETLNECFRQLSTLSNTEFEGIPSSSTGVNATCETFATGMRCVHSWTSKCMTESNRLKLMESIRGAQEALSFLCKDQKFQSDFLKHTKCYKKISSEWDECANTFISSVRSASSVHNDNPTQHCCIRINFRRCVSGVLHHFCSKEASMFLMKIAETLVKKTMKGQQPENCDSARILEQCEKGDEAIGICGKIQILLPMFLIMTILSHRLISTRNF